MLQSGTTFVTPTIDQTAGGNPSPARHAATSQQATQAEGNGKPITPTIAIGVAAAIIASLQLVNARRQTLRDGLFKCFEGYLKVMEYKSKALEAERKPPREKQDEYQRFEDYYRSLFDLQWTEYYLWRNRPIRDKPYRQWLMQRSKQYKLTEVARQHGATAEPISYALVWNSLRTEYFEPNDPFLVHVDNVHAGNVDAAIQERKLWEGWF